MVTDYRQNLSLYGLLDYNYAYKHNTYIFEGSEAESRGQDGGVSNLPLGVARSVVITDSGLCDC